MRQKKISTIVTLVLTIIFLALVWQYGFTVVKIEDAERAIQNEAFDAVTYVDSIWSSQILPAFDEKAVDLYTILSALQPDASGIIDKESLVEVTNKYGLITQGESHVYMVKGSGRIISVNTENSLGTIEVALEGYTGPIKTLLYVGTRIPSDDTSVRDAVGFISFGDFKEQTEYGKVGSEINKRILSDMLDSLDKNSLLNKTISFKGAMNIRTFNLIKIELKDIRIVPVEINLGG